MRNTQDAPSVENILFELSQKEVHLIKILRNIAYGDVTIKKQANSYVVATVNQSIKLEADPKNHVIVRDVRNIGIPDAPIQA